MSRGISRRRFLSSSTATALLLASPLSVGGYVDTRNRGGEDIRVLIGGEALAKQLEKHLVRFDRTDSPVPRQHHSMVDVKALRSWLSNNAGRKLLGAVASDLYPILETLIRDLGGAGLFHGRHRVALNGRSSHQFYTVPDTQGAAVSFMTRLGSHGRVCQASEFCIGANESVINGYSSAMAISTPDWLTVVADMLADIALGNWRAGPVDQFPAVTGDTGLQAVTGIETFVFQI